MDPRKDFKKKIIFLGLCCSQPDLNISDYSIPHEWLEVQVLKQFLAIKSLLYLFYFKVLWNVWTANEYDNLP